MNRAGALELVMPVVQPAELWQESGRWSEYGPELLRFKDRHERDFVLGPTHEEVITDIVRRELQSYRQLPVNFYQIQTKFRDEVRPRFGVMRAREFIMKDAYSFHLDEASLQAGYRAMYDAYTRIFTRTGLTFRAVRADSGAIGGDVSQEFHVLADSGEDAIVFSDGDDYAANLEPPRRCRRPRRARAPREPLRKVATPGARTIADLARFLKVRARALREDAHRRGQRRGRRGGARGARRSRAECGQGAEARGRGEPARAGERRRASSRRPAPSRATSGRSGSKCRVYADHSALALADFVCGANEKDLHLTGVNWDRDVSGALAADLRNVVEGDPSPSGRGRLKIARGIEVGHIFQLGSKYSEPMKAMVLDEAGREMTLLMGCYGIGVTRIVAAAIEQNHDERGIIWPAPIAPFQVVLVPLNLQKSARVREVSDRLYAELGAAGIEVLYDDRDARPGVKFADAELLGIPHRLVVAERGLEAGRLEYRHRRDSASTEFPAADALAFLRARLGGLSRRAAPLPRPASARAAGLAAAALAVLALSACAARALADQQRDPELRAVVARAIAAGAVLHRSIRLGRLVHADGAAAAPARQAEGRAARHPQAGVLRDPPRRRGAAAAGTGHGADRGREPLRPLGGLTGGRRRADAGDAVLARAARHAPLRAGARRSQHPHGLRDPALLPRLRAQRRAQGAGALQRQPGQAQLPRSRAQPVDALERRRRSGVSAKLHTAAALSRYGCARSCGGSMRATPSRRESAAPW